MILAPSEIHFLRDATEQGLLTPDETTLAALSSRFSEGDEQIPKVQVTEKNGSWFALNNSYLHIVKDLEKKGKCARVRVEVVPLTKVPKTIQKGMVCDPCCESVKQSNCRLPHSCQTTSNQLESDTDDTSSYTSSDYSDYDDGDDDDDDISGSEYDEDLTCNVCNRSFGSTRLLSQHQQRKRHFGCSVCDSCFPSLHGLEMHKESLEHWSDDDGGNTYESDSDEGERRPRDATGTDDEVQSGCDKKPEEVERLL